MMARNHNEMSRASKLKASMQKYEKKRQALDDEKRKRQARVETGKLDRNFKSSSQAGFYSILFSNKFTYQEKKKLLDARCHNLRLICGVTSETLPIAKSMLEENFKISSEMIIPTSQANTFNLLILLDEKQGKTRTKGYSFEDLSTISVFQGDAATKGYKFGKLRVGTFFTHGVISANRTQGQKIFETIRYMQNKSAQVQLNVLTKAQFVYDDAALLERFFLSHYIHQKLCDELNFTEYELQYYGSAITGFANKYSDVDLCLVEKFPKETAKSNASPEELFRTWRYHAKLVMSELYRALNKGKRGYNVIAGITDQQLVDSAKHPIIKTEFSPLNLEFDMSAQDNSLLSMAQLHNYYSSLDRRVIPFIGIMRLWSKLMGFSSHGLGGQMSPYIITQMALNYLMSIGFIPHVAALKRDIPTRERVYHLGEDVSFKPDLSWKCKLEDPYLEMNAAQKMNMTLHEYRTDNPIIEDLYSDENIHILLFGFMDYVERFDQRSYEIDSSTGETRKKTNSTAALVITNPFTDKPISSGVRYDEYLKFKQGCSGNKYKILFDLFNQRSFPRLQSRPDLTRSNVEGWTGLSGLLNPFIQFDQMEQRPFFVRDGDERVSRQEGFLISEGLTRKSAHNLLKELKET